MLPQTAVSAEFPALLGTVDVSWWGLRGEKKKETKGWWKKEQPGEPAHSLILQAAVGGKEKPLVLLGMKKKWRVYDAEMPEHFQRVSTKASLISFTRAVTVSYTSTVLFM